MKFWRQNLQKCYPKSQFWKVLLVNQWMGESKLVPLALPIVWGSLMGDVPTFSLAFTLWRWVLPLKSTLLREPGWWRAALAVPGLLHPSVDMPEEHFSIAP